MLLIVNTHLLVLLCCLMCEVADMNNLPSMTHQERQARAGEKRERLLNFLASGEVWTSTQLAADLLQVSRPVALNALVSLGQERAIVSEFHMIMGRTQKIWGITSHGLALAEVVGNVSAFQLGRTNPSHIPHHLQTQQARIAAESAGWDGWVPGKLLYNRELRKVPDAAATAPSGNRVAVEIERYIKSPKRYSDIIAAYLRDIKEGRFDEVHYLAPGGLHVPLEKVFRGIKAFSFAGEQVQVEERHQKRFKFYSLDEWPIG
jgi:hypothetical protein